MRRLHGAGRRPRRALLHYAGVVRNRPKITTLAGIGTPEKPHPVQKAWIEEQVNQCGYCISGWILTAVELLERNPQPTDAQIKEALNGLICRCGTQKLRSGRSSAPRTGVRRRVMTEISLSRRAFLSSTGALVVTLAAPADWAGRRRTRRCTRPPLKGDQLSSYITIDADGDVVAYYGKIDGGQGLGTAIAQMVAEEIDVPYERVRVVMGDSALTLDMGGASAAIGVSHGGMVLRHTAAEARRLLIEMAGRQARPAGDQADGHRRRGSWHRGDNKRVTYAELIGGRYFESKVKWNGRLEQRTCGRGPRRR